MESLLDLGILALVTGEDNSEAAAPAVIKVIVVLSLHTFSTGTINAVAVSDSHLGALYRCVLLRNDLPQANRRIVIVVD